MPKKIISPYSSKEMLEKNNLIKLLKKYLHNTLETRKELGQIATFYEIKMYHVGYLAGVSNLLEKMKTPMEETEKTLNKIIEAQEEIEKELFDMNKDLQGDDD